jgi:hypothetical protein
MDHENTMAKPDNFFGRQAKKIIAGKIYKHFIGICKYVFSLSFKSDLDTCNMYQERLNLLHEFTALSFGRPLLASEERAFYDAFNRHMIDLVYSLPVSMQTESLLFLMQYAGMRIGEKLDLFRNYHSPSWSFLYWIGHAEKVSRRLTPDEMECAAGAQAMAMFLHSLDDHIHDGSMTPSHLLLLLRSQAWLLMKEKLIRFTGGNAVDRATIDDFINTYYEGISSRATLSGLDEYCRLFRRQMATWTLIPYLASLKRYRDRSFADDIKEAYECFGIAWRLLDDINDVEEDMHNHEHSAVYYLLPRQWQILWDSHETVRDINELMLHIHAADTIDTLILTAEKYLLRAETIVRDRGMTELADELMTLRGPLALWLHDRP